MDVQLVLADHLVFPVQLLHQVLICGFHFLGDPVQFLHSQLQVGVLPLDLCPSDVEVVQLGLLDLESVSD